MEQEYLQILAFTASSALECAKEPSPYGALRLLEVLQQLLEFGSAQGILRDPALASLAERIARESGTALTDRSRFQSLAEETALALVDFV